jgi:hypothetical protein
MDEIEKADLTQRRKDAKAPHEIHLSLFLCELCGFA